MPILYQQLTVKISRNKFCCLCPSKIDILNWLNEIIIKSEFLYCILHHMLPQCSYHSQMLIMSAGDIARYLRSKQRGFSQSRPAMKVWLFECVLSFYLISLNSCSLLSSMLALSGRQYIRLPDPMIHT